MADSNADTNRTEPAQSAEHQHEWVGQGLVRERKLAGSPVSHVSCEAYTLVSSVELCACGEHRKVRVGIEDRKSGYDRQTHRYACDGLHAW